MPIRSLAAASTLGLFLATAGANAQTGEEVVKRWLATNSGVDTLHVEFTQTRKLTSLKAPLSESGALWLDHRSQRFRWQLGDPPKTIVTRQDRELLIVRPREKKFERRPVGKGGMAGMAALARGFPRSVAEFHRKYRLLEVVPRRDTFRIVAQPLDQAARGVRAFTFVVGADGSRLRAIEITFRDGSTQQIVFTKVAVKPPLRPELFKIDLSGYKSTKF